MAYRSNKEKKVKDISRDRQIGKGNKGVSNTDRENKGKKDMERRGDRNEREEVRKTREKSRRQKKKKDRSRKNQPRRGRTQDYKKRKNVRRMAEREEIEEGERRKWRKVPESDRVKRKPEWEEVSSRWDEEMTALEKEQMKVLREGGKVKGRKYVDRGKKRIYSYGMEWNKRELTEKGGKKKRK